MRREQRTCDSGWNGQKWNEQLNVKPCKWEKNMSVEALIRNFSIQEIKDMNKQTVSNIFKIYNKSMDFIE